MAVENEYVTEEAFCDERKIVSWEKGVVTSGKMCDGR